MARVVLPEAELQALTRLQARRVPLPPEPLHLYQGRHFLWVNHERLQPLYEGLVRRVGLTPRWSVAKNGKAFLTLADGPAERFLFEYQRLHALWVLADRTDLTVALDLHRPTPDAPRTVVGELVYQAKYQGSAAALSALCERVVDTARSLGLSPQAGVAPLVCPVPSSRVSQSNLLPARVARAVADALDLPYDPYLLRTVANRPSLKSLPLLEKARSLQGTLELSGAVPAGGTVLLIDDHYQSGTMMNYLALALRAAGVAKVLALACDKTLGSRDNTGGEPP